MFFSIAPKSDHFVMIVSHGIVSRIHYLTRGVIFSLRINI
ncbi:hypothetical protein PROSTU_00074 [Providencia stuartii ATCC 25827]|uniref:Uncharacterized protein n=1 Tax=Providencia stuartii ATCC 25827 TaxID=471874 RepID=A0AA86Z4E0_PROST|nr:hypothetical protein PROSTU_04125 [Providencia stuartii ATCC 25827]EDU61154.1 hypothetical protein PROSTU_00837 [Providencia stuartii ATCC 25827]EDU61872.1 hypothetical protein PROSTU_00107 [Providencia stuartii ATCC 25827]EDU61905.1 hypothetical protein PROSTU_00074 [Providencia stuartii ATCC 25827]